MPCGKGYPADPTRELHPHCVSCPCPQRPVCMALVSRTCVGCVGGRGGVTDAGGHTAFQADEWGRGVGGALPCHTGPNRQVPCGKGYSADPTRELHAHCLLCPCPQRPVCLALVNRGGGAVEGYSFWKGGRGGGYLHARCIPCPCTPWPVCVALTGGWRRSEPLSMHCLLMYLFSVFPPQC